MSLNVKYLMTPIEGWCERGAYVYSKTQEDLTAENYRGSDDQPAFKNKLIQAIKYNGYSKEWWKCNAFHFSVLQATLVGALIILSLKDKDIPNTLLKKKHIRIGPKLKISLGLMGGFDLAQQTCKYVSTYYKHRRKFLEKELEKINQLSIGDSNTLARPRTRTQ